MNEHKLKIFFNTKLITNRSQIEKLLIHYGGCNRLGQKDRNEEKGLIAF